MRDYTNLLWPEEPFGAERRPFGRHRDMLAAFAVDWAPRPDGDPLPVAAATVYLRVRKHGTPLAVDSDTLAIGFRAVVVDTADDVPLLLGVVDRALTRARRHAVIVAGHTLADDLVRMATMSPVPLRGAAGVAAAWVNRGVRERGIALMVDTAAEAADVGADLAMATAPIPAAFPDSPGCGAVLGRTVLARTLAIGLTAAVHAGRYQPADTFRVGRIVEREAWDVLADGEPEWHPAPVGT